MALEKAVQMEVGSAAKAAVLHTALVAVASLPPRRVSPLHGPAGPLFSLLLFGLHHGTHVDQLALLADGAKRLRRGEQLVEVGGEATAHRLDTVQHLLRPVERELDAGEVPIQGLARYAIESGCSMR